jgi:DNA polymerase-3 subunit epsilon
VSTPGELAEFIRGDYLDDGRRLKQCDNGDVELCFGKHAGKTIAEVYDESPGYIDWMRREITELRVHIDDALS